MQSASDGSLRTRKSTKLSAQVHEQIMDYLRLADQSSNPAIVKTATKMAEELIKQNRIPENKTSPSATVTLSTLVGLAAVSACWFAFTHYSGAVAAGISTVVVAMAILIIGIYVLTSGHLSQANFMVIFRWVSDQLKRPNFPKKDNSQGGGPRDAIIPIDAAQDEAVETDED